jgi:hypothetical protein
LWALPPDWGARRGRPHIYDPFLEYFHEAGTHAVFPDFDWWKLISGCFFRFGLIFCSRLSLSFFSLTERLDGAGSRTDLHGFCHHISIVPLLYINKI